VSVLRGIEHRLESLFEGVFGRAFRSHVQPVEIARKLAKEMDDNKRASVSRVYAPNVYHLYLSPRDREQFHGYEQMLSQELAGYLVEHARKQGYALLSTPRVYLREDADLALGEFGIATQYQESQRAARETRQVPTPEPEPEPGLPEPEPAVDDETHLYPPPLVEEPPQPAPLPPPARAALRFEGAVHWLPLEPLVVGRSRECDLVLDDPSASRRHAELRPDGGGWRIVDLGSTNGIEVNGRRLPWAVLADGDVVTIGQTELLFEEHA
jgi:hypothetical protein